MLYTKLTERLSSGFHNTKAIACFCKVMVVSVLLKMLFVWNTAQLILEYDAVARPHAWVSKIVFFPAVMAYDHLLLVYIAFALLLIACVLLPWNYFSGILFFLIVVNIYRITSPVANGADHIQLMLAAGMIFMSARPQLKSEKMLGVQMILYNASVLVTQLAIAFVYFLSGWDKLITPTWRTGDAFLMISNLQHLINPFFSDWLTNPVLNAVLAWLTILFELSFGILVWCRKTRLFILATGIFFHFVIAIMLNLPDFSVMMIVSYMIFLRDADYIYLRIQRPSELKM